MNSSDIVSSIISSASLCIHSQEYIDQYRIKNAFTRSRKLSFSDIMFLVLNYSHHSISINYARLREIFLKEKLPMVSKQALSKARQGISHEAFLHLFRLSVSEYYQHNPNLSLWNGFHVYAIDGSTIQIPDSKENLQIFGANPNKYEKDTPLASVSALYDIMNDILIDVHLNTYRFNERDSAKLHIDFLPDFPNSIVIFDRGYPSEDLFRFLQQKDVFFLMRVPKTFKKAINDETDTFFTYPAKKIENELTLRSIHFPLENGNEEYLVTNLMPEQISESCFRELYSLRWGIESKYRELKNRLEIENFNSLKPVGIKQEFFAAMFLSNLSAIIKKESDRLIAEDLSVPKKHSYQSNRSYILNRIKSLIVVLLKSNVSIVAEMMRSLIQDAAKVLSIVRPGRKYGRYRKHTRRRFYSHMKNCI